MKKVINLQKYWLPGESEQQSIALSVSTTINGIMNHWTMSLLRMYITDGMRRSSHDSGNAIALINGSKENVVIRKYVPNAMKVSTELAFVYV